MSLTPVEVREQQIIALLQEPMTIEALRDELGTNIHTLRKNITHMVQRGVLKPTGQIVDKKPTYVVASNRPIPELYRRRSGKYIHPAVLQQAYASNAAGITPTMRSARYLNDAVSDLLNLVASVQDGEPNAPSKEDVAQQLSLIRASLKDAHATLSESADMITQLLSNPSWWSFDNLKSMANDPEFDSHTVQTLHATIVQDRS
jgi:hypothetical protein